MARPSQTILGADYSARGMRQKAPPQTDEGHRSTSRPLVESAATSVRVWGRPITFDFPSRRPHHDPARPPWA